MVKIVKAADIGVKQLKEFITALLGSGRQLDFNKFLVSELYCHLHLLVKDDAIVSTLSMSVFSKSELGKIASLECVCIHHDLIDDTMLEFIDVFNNYVASKGIKYLVLNVKEEYEAVSFNKLGLRKLRDFNPNDKIFSNVVLPYNQLDDEILDNTMVVEINK